MGIPPVGLSPESREITTFATPDGLFRYKGLLFGEKNCPSPGRCWLCRKHFGWHCGAWSRHRNTQQATPPNYRASARVRSRFTAEKSLFNTDRLVFMGMLLSEKGIGPTADRVKAVLEVEEPKSASDVRSFLGLANYSSQFIPHFATLSESLRRLTRKETPFEFWPERKKSLECLKQKMAEACTLAYFDKNAHTKIITDASPVGLGAVLVQEQDSVMWCYARRSFTEWEQRYS